MIIIIILVVILIGFIYLYNRLVRLNLQCDNAWSLIDVALKRRADLIPNLVKTVEGYSKHESKTLVECMNARCNTVSSRAKNSEEISNSINKIFALQEKYPDLKADQSFKNLQIELVKAEDKIASARTNYNDCVMKYNRTIEFIPFNLFAKAFNYKKHQYFNIKDSERENIKVEL